MGVAGSTECKFRRKDSEGFTGAIALTRVRLVALQYSSTAINVPVDDERIRSLRFSVEEPTTLVVAFDPALFHDGWSGTMEYRFRTSQAQAFLERLLSGCS